MSDRVQCNKCSIEKDALAFYKGRKTCIECKKEYEKEYRDNSKKKVQEYSSRYRNKNAKHIKRKKQEWYEDNKDLCKNKNKEWYENNKERKLKYEAEYRKTNKKLINKRIREYRSRKMASDPIFKIKKNLRNRLNQAVKNNQKAGSAVRDLGCSIEELKSHLEAQFKPGMNWDNYGKWHIDHIKPLAKFNLLDRNELKKACHYTNLQPLWEKDNIRKSNK